MSACVRVCVVVFGVLIVPVSALAQSGAVVQGRVVAAADNSAIPSAPVTLKSAASGR